MVKFTGYTIFIGNIIIIFLLIFSLTEYIVKDWSIDPIGFLGFLTIFLFSIAGIYYTTKTRFWTGKPKVIESMEKENEIIKKKIEKMELLKKLEQYESK